MGRLHPSSLPIFHGGADTERSGLSFRRALHPWEKSHRQTEMEEKMRVYSTQLNFNLMPLFANAARIKNSIDLDAVYDLCRRLTGIETIKYMEASRLVRGLYLPGGYMHVRFCDEENSQQFASLFATSPDRKIRAEELVVSIFMTEKFTLNRWVATKPMLDHPYLAKGVLDLALRFEPRAVPLAKYDID